MVKIKIVDFFEMNNIFSYLALFGRKQRFFDKNKNRAFFKKMVKTKFVDFFDEQFYFLTYFRISHMFGRKMDFLIL